ncbi:hypothetical protein AB4Z55_18055 [Gordonia sp. ABKF26]|uniref:hypothetical protein n=1 Tax=Gordonia sp. ABKF26 TaxID=3238687 RepID=UPI0034E5379C
MPRGHHHTSRDEAGRMNGHLRMLENQPSHTRRSTRPNRADLVREGNPWSGVVQVDVPLSAATYETAMKVVRAARELDIVASAYFEGALLQIVFDVPGDTYESRVMVHRVGEQARAVLEHGVIFSEDIECWDADSSPDVAPSLGRSALRLVPDPDSDG